MRLEVKMRLHQLQACHRNKPVSAVRYYRYYLPSHSWHLVLCNVRRSWTSVWLSLCNAGDTPWRILYKKLVQRQTTQTTNRQIVKSLQTSHAIISLNFGHVCKFFASNRALFYLTQDSCTRKKLVQESMTHSQVFLYKSTVQVSCTKFFTVCHWLKSQSFRTFETTFLSPK